MDREPSEEMRLSAGQPLPADRLDLKGACRSFSQKRTVRVDLWIALAVLAPLPLQLPLRQGDLAVYNFPASGSVAYELRFVASAGHLTIELIEIARSQFDFIHRNRGPCEEAGLENHGRA
jgi:hypothetical protein